jgi:hypothetical protein
MDGDRRILIIYTSFIMKIKCKISKLTAVEEVSLQKIRVSAVELLCKGNFNKNSLDDIFGLIDQFISSSKFRSSKELCLQDLCVFLGDALVNNMGFHWVVVEDIHGLDFAVRYRNTSLVIFPRMLIAKVIDKKEGVGAFFLFLDLVNDLDKVVNRKRRDCFKKHEITVATTP